jgi:flagellar motor switch protein FliN/FliY
MSLSMDAVETVGIMDATATEDEIQFEALTAPAPAMSSGGADLGRVIDVPVELAVEIGRTTMTIGETLSLAPGSIVSLNRLAGEPVDLLVNGKVIAQGEVVVIDEEFGLRITDIVSASQRLSEATAPPVE